MSADPINLDTTLGQFFTPDWAAEALVEQHFGDLGLFDRVVEPSCGGGAFLRALPVPAAHASCPAFGGPDQTDLYVTTARQGLAAPGPLDGATFHGGGHGPGQAEHCVLLPDGA